MTAWTASSSDKAGVAAAINQVLTFTHQNNNKDIVLAYAVSQLNIDCSSSGGKLPSTPETQMRNKTPLSGARAAFLLPDPR